MKSEYAIARKALEQAKKIAIHNKDEVNKLNDQNDIDKIASKQTYEELMAMADYELDLIHATFSRYPVEEVSAREDFTEYWENYVTAMKTLMKKYPSDVDIKALTVEAMMILSPWRFYKKSNDAKSNEEDVGKINSINGSGAGGYEHNDIGKEAYQILTSILGSGTMSFDKSSLSNGVMKINKASGANHLLALHMMVHVTESDKPISSILSGSVRSYSNSNLNMSNSNVYIEQSHGPFSGLIGSVRGESSADFLQKVAPGTPKHNAYIALMIHPLH